MASPLGNALIGQSGGPTAVINQSLVGVVEQALGTAQIRQVYGSLHGLTGVLDERLIDLGRESRETLESVARSPAAALRSARKKPTREECERALAIFRAHDVRYFFYIGGNDSAETANLLNELALAQDYELRLFHVPKTVDNDLRVTDHCPGYGSAARFVAIAHLGDDLDNRSLGGIKLNVMMGRHAGWLTAAASLARRGEDDGPHLLYLPERAFSLDRFAADVDRVYRRLGRCLVAVSEGIHGADGKPLMDSKERDSHGNVQLSGSGALGDFLVAEVKRRLGEKLRIRADTLGYLQRSFLGSVSEIDAREARRCGQAAVEAATGDQHRHGSIVMQRRADAREYEISYAVAPLAQLARETRPMDERFLAGDEGVSPAFRDYALPLIGPLPETRRLAEFPVPKKLS